MLKGLSTNTGRYYNCPSGRTFVITEVMDSSIYFATDAQNKLFSAEEPWSRVSALSVEKPSEAQVIV